MELFRSVWMIPLIQPSVTYNAGVFSKHGPPVANRVCYIPVNSSSLSPSLPPFILQQLDMCLHKIIPKMSDGSLLVVAALLMRGKKQFLNFNKHDIK